MNQSIKQYRKMQKRYKKQLKQQLKEFAPFEWGTMFNIIFTMLKNFQEYYAEKNNVWQDDSSLLPIINSLNEAVRLFQIIDEDKFTDESFEFSKKHVTHHSENGIYWGEWDNKDNYNKWLEIIKKAREEKDKAFIDAFAYIGKYIQEWWD